MDYPCPPSHRFGAWCASTNCPRVGLLTEASESAERAPEHGEVQTASKQQKAANDPYREATQMAVPHPAQHGTLPERLRVLNEEVKKITGSQSGAYLNGMPQIQPISQWPGFAGEGVDWYGGRDLEHDRPVEWQPNAFADFKFSPPQSNNGPSNKNRMLPDWPGHWVPGQSTMGNSQLGTFTDFAPGKNLPSSRSPHRRELPSAIAKDAFCTGEDDGSSSGISSNESEVEFTPEPSPEQEEFHGIGGQAEASKAQVQPDSAHLNLNNAPGKPAYQFVPFRNVPRVINEGSSTDSQRWLEVSNLPGYSGSARSESSEAAGKNHPGSRPVRNDDKTSSSGCRLVRRDAMTFATGDLRKKIEKVARYVARSGPKFEEVVRSKNQGTDIVSFLEPTNTYHTYYKWRVAQCKAGNTYDFESEEVSAETDIWSEHINTDGREHWYNKVSHEFVWDKPLAVVAQFQPRKEIGLGIEKRELDFLGDCVKFLPFAVRSKAIAVVDKLQNIAYGALSDELPAGEEDDATKKLQKLEAALKLIESKHADTESSLLKRIEELKNEQTFQMPEATAAKLNTLYDKLGHIVDQGVQQLESGQKSNKDQEIMVSKLQQRIEELEGKQAAQFAEVSAAQVHELDAKNTRIVSGPHKRIQELEGKQASQVAEVTASQLHELDAKHGDIVSALQKRIEELGNKQCSQSSELVATQRLIGDEVGKAVEKGMTVFRDDRQIIDDEHKEVVSALAKLTVEVEKQKSVIPDSVASRLHELFDKFGRVDERLNRVDTGLETFVNEDENSKAALLKRIDELHGQYKQIVRTSNASASELQYAIEAQAGLHALIVKLQDDHDEQVNANAKEQKSTLEHVTKVSKQAKKAQEEANKALDEAYSAREEASEVRAGLRKVRQEADKAGSRGYY